MALRAGGTRPFDRAYAIENGPGPFDPAHPAHLPKINFLMLMRNERLADAETPLRRRDRDADHPAGRQAGGTRRSAHARCGRKMIEEFLAAYMQAELRGARASSSRPATASRTSRPSACTSSILQSVRELERVIGPRRDTPALPAQRHHRWLPSRGANSIGPASLAARARAVRGVQTHRALRGDQRRSGTGKRDMDIPAAAAARLRPHGFRYLRARHGRRHDRGRRCPLHGAECSLGPPNYNGRQNRLTQPRHCAASGGARRASEVPTEKPVSSRRRD